MNETRLRSFAKALVYRAVATALLFDVSYIYTGNAGESTIISIVFNVLAGVAYYLLERLWNVIEWGKAP